MVLPPSASLQCCTQCTVYNIPGLGCVPAADVEYVVEGYERLQIEPSCHSLLKKHLTREVLNQLKDLATASFRSSLRDVIQVDVRIILCRRKYFLGGPVSHLWNFVLLCIEFFFFCPKSIYWRPRFSASPSCLISLFLRELVFPTWYSRTLM